MTISNITNYFNAPQPEEKIEEGTELIEVYKKKDRSEIKANAERIDQLVYAKFPFIREFGGREKFEALIAAPFKSLTVEISKEVLYPLSSPWTPEGNIKPVLHLEDATHITISMNLSMQDDGYFGQTTKVSETWNFKYRYEILHALRSTSSSRTEPWFWKKPFLAIVQGSYGSGGLSNGGYSLPENYGDYLKRLVSGENCGNISFHVKEGDRTVKNPLSWGASPKEISVVSLL